MTFLLELDRALCPDGFEAAGIACGIKKRGGPDLALIHAPDGATSAAMFTTNLVRAVPLEISKAHLEATRGLSCALLVNSGCANAATGDEGRRRAMLPVHALAAALGCGDEEILINSTGVIGVQLASEKIVDAIPELLASRQSGDLVHAARAIMTTDTVPKMVQVHVSHEGRTLHIAGIAKGSGMIHPNMATMIGVLLTNAEIETPELDAALRAAVDRSFHRITVDGDTSTNDAVFAMASRKGGRFPNELVRDAMIQVARELALMIVRDGEGARKLIHVEVVNAHTERDALALAYTVASSLLVRTAVTGGDPNWGRILAACGRAGVALDPRRLTLHAGEILLFENGAPAQVARETQEEVFQRKEVPIRIDLHAGNAREEYWTCDLTEGYVHINADYTT